MEEVSARLGRAWEAREATPGRRPVREIAGTDQRLTDRQPTRRQQTEDAMPVLTADHEERQEHPPGERATYALDRQAADRTRPPKHKVPRSLSELRERWRASAIRAFGACTTHRLAERARAAAAAVWARVRPVADVALADADTVTVVYVMRGAFKRRHLLAEARRHLAHALRDRPHQPGLDEQLVRSVVDDYTRPAGRRMTTADPRALYPRDTEDQAVLRPLTRNRTAAPHERARPAAGARTARVHAVRRSDRLGSRCTPPPCPPPQDPRAPLPHGPDTESRPGADDRRRHGGADPPDDRGRRPMPGTLARPRCAAPDAPHRTGAHAAQPPPDQVRHPARFPLRQHVPAADQVAVKGVCDTGTAAEQDLKHGQSKRACAQS
jgi:hypothetical protein